MTGTLIRRALATAAPKGVTSADAVSGVLEVWRKMFAVLVPVIGEGGVTALFLRTCTVTRSEHNWICRPETAMGSSQALDVLFQSLTTRSVDEICAASHDMLTTFVTILGSLIGAPLTERLLGMAWPAGLHDVCDGDTPS